MGAIDPMAVVGCDRAQPEGDEDEKEHLLDCGDDGIAHGVRRGPRHAGQPLSAGQQDTVGSRNRCAGSSSERSGVTALKVKRDVAAHPPGFRSGAHSHTADYWAVVVQGAWEHWVPSTGEGKAIRLESGSHWTQVKTQLHEDACVSDVPCIIFLFNKTPYVTQYPREQH
jgi:hypothetical protein